MNMKGIQRLRIDFPDQELEFRVKSFLSSRHFPGFENIKVNVVNGSVTLSGSVSSFYEKQVAMNSCQRVAGVIKLVDQIGVESANKKLNLTQELV